MGEFPESALTPCKVFDWKELAGLFRVCFPTIPDEEISYQLRNYRPDIRLLRFGGELVGFTIMIRKGSDVAWLEQIAVHPKFRAMGASRMLLQDFEARAVELGFTQAQLAVYADNIPAVGLYESAGYRPLPNLDGKPMYEKTLKRNSAGIPRKNQPISANPMSKLWSRILYAVLAR